MTEEKTVAPSRGRALVGSEKGVNGQLAKYVRTFLESGLVRKVVTSEGTTYEITEAGARLFRAHEEAASHLIQDTGKLGQIDFSGVLQRLFKEQVTVVLPVLDEAEALNGVIEEIRSEGYEHILVVDGFSKDKSDEIARKAGVPVTYQHGAGKAGAVKTAIENTETPYLVFMDGDATYDPKDIWRLLLHSERYSHVIGVREKKYIPRIHRFGNWIISRTFSLLFGVRTSDVCSGMYLLETEEARKYDVKEPGFVAEVELAAQSASTGALTEVPINYRPRVGSRKLNTWRHGWAILSAAFTLSGRYNPIMLYSVIAGLTILPAAPLLAWVALEQLTRHSWHSGWALFAVMLLIVAAQAFTLASISILTKHTEERLMREVKSSRAAS